MADPRALVSSGENQMCSHCNQYPAVVFCSCMGLKTFLCMEDMPRHYEKNSAISHPILPVQALASVDTPEYYERFQQRSTRFTQGKEALLENLSLIDKCCQEYMTAIDQLMMDIANYRDYVFVQLQTEKRKLEAKIWETITEVQSTLSVEHTNLKKPLSVALRGYHPGKLNLFQYLVNMRNNANMIGDILEYQFSEPKLSSEDFQKLIAVGEKEIKYFNFSIRQWEQLFPLPSKIVTDFGSSSTLIGVNKIFVCGGGNSRNECCIRYLGNNAYVLEEGQSKNQQSFMLVPRRAPGVIYDSNFLAVYVFGGRSANNSKGHTEQLRCCESFLISSSRWEQLPDMNNSRYGFNPCMQSNVIYLCGGFDTSVELFNPRSRSFSLLPLLSLPEQARPSPHTAVVDSDALVVISKYNICKWSLEHRQIELIKEHSEYDQDLTKYSCPWSNCPPVLIDGICFGVDLFRQICRGISLANGEEVSAVSLE